MAITPTPIHFRLTCPTVLVVEDDPDQMVRLLRLLDAAGFEAVVARRVSDALALLPVIQPDVVALGLAGLRGDQHPVDAIRRVYDGGLVVIGPDRTANIKALFLGADDAHVAPIDGADLVRSAARLSARGQGR